MRCADRYEHGLGRALLERGLAISGYDSLTIDFKARKYLFWFLKQLANVVRIAFGTLDFYGLAFATSDLL